MVRGDPSTAGRWEREVEGCDVVVNLAGERIVDPPHRWTTERKRRLRVSRVETTRNVASAIRAARKTPAALISGSAIGYYGGRGDDVLDETSPPGTDFLAALCVDWEAAALEAETCTNVTLIRSGVVLGKGGGGLSPLMTVFKLGIGGPWGDGKQWWSWIHLADEVGLILRLIQRPIAGAINLTAPHPITVDQFAEAMGRAAHRPAGIRVPEFALRLALGEAADALLNLQRVLPKRAGEIGYQFQFAGIDQALGEIFSPGS
jgi:hypothetical protein